MKLKKIIAFSVVARISVVIGCAALIFARYSIGFKINNGLPPLVKAASETNKETVEALLEAGYFVDQPDEDFNVALHYAAMLSDDPNGLDIVHMLLDNYASARQQNSKGVVPLHGVAEVDNLDTRMAIIRALLLHGARFQDRDTQGFGVLERTIELIDNAGLQTTLDWWGWITTPDDIAKAKARAEYYNNGFTVRTMQEFSPGESLIEDKNEFGDLIKAVMSGDAQAVEMVLKQNKELINRAEKYFGLTPLHIAVVQPEESASFLVKVLVKNGADVNAKDKRGATALLRVMHSASLVQKKQLIAYLVKNGADINAQDNNKDTLLHIAVKKNDHALVGYLLETFEGIKKRKKNEQGKTPRELARELDYGDMYKMLR